MNYVYTTVSRTGLIREHNEDSLGVFKVADGTLIIVCDGLGGNKAGEVASQLTVDTVYDFFKNSELSDFNERIRLSIIEANKLVYKKSSEENNLQGMATTVEALFLLDNTAYWGHVGDSRIYFYSDNKINQLTKDHSYVQKLIDEGIISDKEAEAHPNKNIITRALGDNNNIEIDLGKKALTLGEKIFFMVCTDGVTCAINNYELAEIFKLDDIHSISRKISMLVEERGAPDNFSFVLIGN